MQARQAFRKVRKSSLYSYWSISGYRPSVSPSCSRTLLNKGFPDMEFVGLYLYCVVVPNNLAQGGRFLQDCPQGKAGNHL